jgi:hypothetical protein
MDMYIQSVDTNSRVTMATVTKVTTSTVRARVALHNWYIQFNIN